MQPWAVSEKPNATPGLCSLRSRILSLQLPGRCPPSDLPQPFFFTYQSSRKTRAAIPTNTIVTFLSVPLFYSVFSPNIVSSCSVTSSSGPDSGSPSAFSSEVSGSSDIVFVWLLVGDLRAAFHTVRSPFHDLRLTHRTDLISTLCSQFRF